MYVRTVVCILPVTSRTRVGTFSVETPLHAAIRKHGVTMEDATRKGAGGGGGSEATIDSRETVRLLLQRDALIKAGVSLSNSLLHRCLLIY